MVLMVHPGDGTTDAAPASGTQASGTVASGTQASAQSGTQASGTQAPAQSGTQASGTQAPAQSGTQASGTQAPAQSGTQAPGTQAPGTQAPAQSGTQALGTQAPAQSGTQAPQSGTQASGTQAPVHQSGTEALGTQTPAQSGTHASGTQAPAQSGTQVSAQSGTQASGGAGTGAAGAGTQAGGAGTAGAAGNGTAGVGGAGTTGAGGAGGGTAGAGGAGGGTTAAADAGAAPGKAEDIVETESTIGVTNCSQAEAMASSKEFCDGARDTMASLVSVDQKYVSTDCKKGGSCARRLSAEVDSSSRKLAASPAVLTVYRIIVPPGSSSSAVKSGVTSINPATFQSSLVSNLANTQFGASVTSVGAFSAPVASTSYGGYEKCYEKQACTFKKYTLDTHYKIISVAPIAAQECAEKCIADSDCEGFESLSGTNAPSCSFWMNGACDIKQGNPPGYVTGYDYAKFCDKVGARKTFTENVSMCHRSCILGFWWTALSIFFMLP